MKPDYPEKSRSRDRLAVPLLLAVAIGLGAVALTPVGRDWAAVWWGLALVAIVVSLSMSIARQRPISRWSIATLTAVAAVTAAAAALVGTVVSPAPRVQ